MKSRQLLKEISLGQEPGAAGGEQDLQITLSVSSNEMAAIRYFIQKPHHQQSQQAVWNLLKQWFEGDVTDGPSQNFPG
jgi:hypothetical protein